MFEKHTRKQPGRIKTPFSYFYFAGQVKVEGQQGRVKTNTNNQKNSSLEDSSVSFPEIQP